MFIKLKTGWEAIKNSLNKTSKCFLLPVALLPVAGLLRALGAIISNAGGSLEVSNIFDGLGKVVFDNLSLLFAFSVAIIFTKRKNKVETSITVFIAYFTFIALQGLIIKETNSKQYALWFHDILDAGLVVSNLGLKQLNTSIISGLIIGAIVAVIHNKLGEIEISSKFRLFNETRLVNVIIIPLIILLSLGFLLLWPYVYKGLMALGNGIGNAPSGLDSFSYGFVEKATMPFGFHNLLNALFFWTPVGGTLSPESVITYTFKDQQFTGTLKEYFIATGGNMDFFNSIFKGIETITGDSNIAIALRKLNLAENITNKYINNEIFSSHLKATFTISGETFTGTLKEYFKKTANMGLFNSVFKDGESVFGDQNIWLAIQKLKLPFNVFNNLGINAGKYMFGRFPIMMFCLPAIASAIILATKRGNRLGSFYKFGIPAIIAATTGVTEAIELPIFFAAPGLYFIIYVPLTALVWLATNLLGANLGSTFSGGFVDFLMYGIIPDAFGMGTKSWVAVAVGLPFGVIFFGLFYIGIKRKYINIVAKSEDELQLEKTRNLCSKILENLGGYENINKIDNYQLIAKIVLKDNNLYNLKKMEKVGEFELKDNSYWIRFYDLKPQHLKNYYEIIAKTETSSDSSEVGLSVPSYDSISLSDEEETRPTANGTQKPLLEAESEINDTKF